MDRWEPAIVSTFAGAALAPQGPRRRYDAKQTDGALRGHQRAAKALCLEIPPTLLARADEVIE